MQPTTAEGGVMGKYIISIWFVEKRVNDHSGWGKGANSWR